MSAAAGSSAAAPQAPPPGPEQSSRRTERLLLVAVVLAVLFQVGPLFRLPYATDAIVGSDSYRSHDWQEVAKLELYARRSLLEWKRFPLWNPLLAGGTPQLAHPSDGSSSPLILSSLIFGETFEVLIKGVGQDVRNLGSILFVHLHGVGLGWHCWLTCRSWCCPGTGKVCMLLINL